MRLVAGLRADLLGSLQRSPDPITGRGGEGEEGVRKGKRREGRGGKREGEEGKGPKGRSEDPPMSEVC